MSKVFKPKTGRKDAKRAAARQQQMLDRQDQQEKARIAEAEDEGARTRAIAKRGGLRSSLITGSELGIPTPTKGKATKMGG